MAQIHDEYGGPFLAGLEEKTYPPQDQAAHNKERTEAREDAIPIEKAPPPGATDVGADNPVATAETGKNTGKLPSIKMANWRGGRDRRGRASPHPVGRGGKTPPAPDETRNAVIRHEKHADRAARTATRSTDTGDAGGNPKWAAKRARESIPRTGHQHPSAAASGQNDLLDAVLGTVERAVLTGEAQHRRTPPPPPPRGIHALITAYTKGM